MEILQLSVNSNLQFDITALRKGYISIEQKLSM
jgi:hypothetical protein